MSLNSSQYCPFASSLITYIKGIYHLKRRKHKRTKHLNRIAHYVYTKSLTKYNNFISYPDNQQQ